MTTTNSDPYTRAVADTKDDRTALYYAGIEAAEEESRCLKAEFANEFGGGA